MLYLIGGSPRAGKTQLSKRMLRKRPMACIPLDAVHGALTDVEGDLGWDDELPRMKAAAQFEPMLSSLAMHLDRQWDDAVIEGAVILPKHVVRLRRSGLPVAACFIGWSQANLETILAHGGSYNWASRQTARVQQRGLHDCEVLSRHLERECRRHDLPYIDMAAGTYRSRHTLALNALLADAERA